MDQRRPAQNQMEDYESIGHLGSGAYGEVVLAQRKSDKQKVAIKLVDKRFVLRERKQYQIMIEKEFLLNLKHPGIVTLHRAFKTNEKLCFVMEYLEGGDLAELLKLHANPETLTFEHRRFYLAEIVLILEFLHSKGIVHRDIKPENLMLTSTGHLKVIDFGTATVVNPSLVKPTLLEKFREIKGFKGEDGEGQLPENGHRATFVGTAEYVSPELLDDEICSYPADLWALGVICYKMFVGKTPFSGSTDFNIFNNVKSVTYNLPAEVPLEAADFVRKLLIRDPNSRLGVENNSVNYKIIKQHPLFKGVNFDRLYESQAPQLKNAVVKKVDKALDPDLVIGEQKKSKLLFFGVVQLKVGWFIYRPLDLVLIKGKDYLKLAFYDPETQQTIKKVRLVDSVSVYSSKARTMEIKVSKDQKYVIKEVEHPIEKWLDVIERNNKMMKEKRAKKSQHQPTNTTQVEAQATLRKQQLEDPTSDQTCEELPNSTIRQSQQLFQK